MSGSSSSIACTARCSTTSSSASAAPRASSLQDVGEFEVAPAAAVDDQRNVDVAHDLVGPPVALLAIDRHHVGIAAGLGLAVDRVEQDAAVAAVLGIVREVARR